MDAVAGRNNFSVHSNKPKKNIIRLAANTDTYHPKLLPKESLNLKQNKNDDTSTVIK